ncbi:NAD-glutamate dehydrogenase [Natronoglycomyces albus]|uniref:NAD-glutamate dehydrogenase n=1 Tax=Natronoglycomyces albus TaxID=2811108 RepID=A0A895XG24_9ACTN|nr:NAD-glutamate dehydrogenase [Natronoglycomyces albus]QSB04284.1 NAD-glutamate dehydrogenase [Natronoglycomyces albus]
MLSFIGDEEFSDVLPNREALLEEAASLAGSKESLSDLVDVYWRLVADDDLVGRSAQELLDITVTHRRLADRRMPGEVCISVEAPNSEEGPDAESHTRFSVVCDDMPFLVDSLTGVFNRHNIDIDVFVHPVVSVQRDAEGKLLRAPYSGEEAVVESWMHIEVQRLTDETLLSGLQQEILDVLGDVRVCVEDWQPMRTRALEIAARLESDAANPPVPQKDLSDTVELLHWLADNNFTFLGYREYRLVEEGDDTLLKAVEGSALGLLRNAPNSGKSLSSMAPEAREQVYAKRLLMITKANGRSTVHRTTYMDYIGVKLFNDNGDVIGEQRFLGLFATAAYQASVKVLPVVKRKVAEVIERSGLTLTSHAGKDLVQALEAYPRDELFQTRTDDLYSTVMGVLRLRGRRRLRLFVRRDNYGRFVSCLVYLPRDRFNTANRLKIQNILVNRLGGIGVDFATRVSDSVLARLHFIVRLDPANTPEFIDVEGIQSELSEATRSWDADLALQLDHHIGQGQARSLYEEYHAAYPDTYKAEHTPLQAAQDIAKLELVSAPGDMALHLFRVNHDDARVRFKIYNFGKAITLSKALPVLQSLGLEATEERPYVVKRSDGNIYMHDFGLRMQCPEGEQVPQLRSRVENAFRAAWMGEAEHDPFNELVVCAKLTWQQVVVLRSYAKYLQQAGTIHTQDFIAQTLIDHSDIAAGLLELFEARFKPSIEGDRDALAATCLDHVEALLADVPSLDADRILRSFLTLILNTLRTSYYQRTKAGRLKNYVAYKINARAVDFLPEPRPSFEVFVYSPRMEGVHMRYGKVARGGLRWSDRREDFRTEILGLVKAQEVKNTVITPVGSKGGFVVKRTDFANREERQEEGIACYKMFISSLLDVTDNRDAEGNVVPPRDIVRHDGDDPYLVVAADKGTATFSDIANEVSAAYGFWLGDAFASGGSVGYDHKKMGITARGAWESVKRHFRAMDHNTQTQDFTVVGIGDMGGDVFGNGMLCSEHIRLVAAFNHMHIFVDPDPDPATSFQERKRLFDLPRSTWADYDPKLISSGGGVWERSAKSIPISPQMRHALGIDEKTETLNPQQLIQAILKAPVDLLWNGGIGTYIKATSEANSDVGDKANDAVRVNGKDVRCRVIGEGGNLGLTQLGRIEIARNEIPRGADALLEDGDGVRAKASHGRLITDFIDNSAGVDTSDHEVNIKILLASAMVQDRIEPAARDQLFMNMSDEVATMVLGDNYQQNFALANASRQAGRLLGVHRRLIKYLGRNAQLNRELEFLPNDKDLNARAAVDQGLCEPELAVILSYVKIHLKRLVLDSALPDEDWTEPVLRNYFPEPLREDYADLMAEHPLRREIVATAVVNEVVNRGGTTFVFRVADETGADPIDVIRAYLIVRDVFGLNEQFRRVEALDNRAPQNAQISAQLVIRRVMDRGVRWLIQHRRAPLDITSDLVRLRPGMTTLLPQLPNMLRGIEADNFATFVTSLEKDGVPAELATDVVSCIYGFGLLDAVEVARETNNNVEDVADLYYQIAARIHGDEILNQISVLPRASRWQTLARLALRYDLYGALAALTRTVISAGDGKVSATALEEWEAANVASLDRVVSGVAEAGHGQEDLAILSVILRHIRSLVEANT